MKFKLKSKKTAKKEKEENIEEEILNENEDEDVEDIEDDDVEINDRDPASAAVPSALKSDRSILVAVVLGVLVVVMSAVAYYFYVTNYRVAVVIDSTDVLSGIDEIRRLTTINPNNPGTNNNNKPEENNENTDDENSDENTDDEDVFPTETEPKFTFAGTDIQGDEYMTMAGFFLINDDETFDLVMAITTEDLTAETEKISDSFIFLQYYSNFPSAIVGELNGEVRAINNGATSASDGSDVPINTDDLEFIANWRAISPEFGRLFDQMITDNRNLNNLVFNLDMLFDGKIYPVIKYDFSGENLSEELVLYNMDSDPDVRKQDYRRLQEINAIREAVDPEADRDEDGLSDYIEVEVWGTDYDNPDTDGDGYDDGSEITNGYNPLGEGELTDSQKQLLNKGIF